MKGFSISLHKTFFLLYTAEMTEINAPVDVERTQLLQLAVRREWTTLKQILNTLEKGDPEISQVDEVSVLMICFCTAKCMLSYVNSGSVVIIYSTVKIENC